MSYDWTGHPAVTPWEGCYLVADPQGRGTWKVIRANGGWIAKGHTMRDWQVLGIHAPGRSGEFVTFANEQMALAAILGQPS